jgi:hypothetical protein
MQFSLNIIVHSDNKFSGSYYRLGIVGVDFGLEEVMRFRTMRKSKPSAWLPELYLRMISFRRKTPQYFSVVRPNGHFSGEDHT